MASERAEVLGGFSGAEETGKEAEERIAGVCVEVS